MAALDIEIIPIEGIDLENTPPCQINNEDNVTKCGAPSVARLRIVCQNCAVTASIFVCQPCVDLMRSGKMSCSRCWAVNYSWQEI